MAKNKVTKKGSSIFKGGASRLLRGGKGRTGDIRIGSYSLSNLSSLKGAGFFDDGCVIIAAFMVMIAVLAQLRCLRPDANSAKMDQTPAYKFYKKRLIVSDAGRTAACLVASTTDEAVVHLPDDPNEISDLLCDILDCYQGNERLLDKCSKDNLPDYLAGHMSRILGLAASCPASNFTIFGFDVDCVNWKIEDVLSKIPCDEVSAVPAAEVRKFILTQCGISPDSETENRAIAFDEKPYLGNSTVKGGCLLESDIFGDLMPVRTRGPQEPQAKVKVGNDDLAAAKEHLTPIEVRKLEAAVNLGKSDLVKKLVTLANERKSVGAPEGESSSKSPEVVVKTPPVRSKKGSTPLQ